MIQNTGTVLEHISGVPVCYYQTSLPDGTPGRRTPDNPATLELIVREHGKGEVPTDAAAGVLTLLNVSPGRVAALSPKIYDAMREIERLYTGGPTAL